MQLFYKENIEDKKVIFLDKQESAHCSKVLRANINDNIYITDGKGFLYTGIIIDANPKKTSVEIVERKQIEKPRNYNLHIAIAPTKSMDRFEWFVEKAVEIGIDKITPLLCRYSERKIIKNERIDKIIVSAMKQSLKYHKPILEDMTDFKEFVKKENSYEKYLAYCKAGTTFVNNSLQKDILFLIGPEGGFAEYEYELAIKNNFKAVKFTNSRFRTETAGVYLTSAINSFFLK